MDIILTKQLHEADKAGTHTDWRVVVGDKALSFATKKPEPPVGGKLILWEQPVHTASYALSKKVVIPKGQYGAGTTTLVYAQKGTGEISGDQIRLKLNNGDHYFIKKTPSYGDKAWLLVKQAAEDQQVTSEDVPALVQALLLSRPVHRTSAQRAYAGLQEANLVTQEQLKAVPFEDLAKVLKANGYGRFDLKTGRELKEIADIKFPRSINDIKYVGPKTRETFGGLRGRS